MEETRPLLAAYEDLASRVELDLAAPALTEEQVHDGCRLARECGARAVTVRPSDADLAVRWLDGSGVAVAGVVGFPHGWQTTAVKLYEARDLLRRGAREIEMALNTGKLVSRQFQYIESELVQMTETCHETGAVLKVVLDTAHLTAEHQVIACKMCRLAGVDFAAVVSGFPPALPALEVLRFVRPRLKERAGLKVCGVAVLGEALAAYEAGADRFGTAAAGPLLAAWKALLAERARAAQDSAGSQVAP